MNAILTLLFIICLVYIPSSAYGNGQGEGRDIWKTVRMDYQHFYSPDPLLHMGIAYGIGSTMANTAIDENIENTYQNRLRNDDSDDAAEIAKIFGEGTYLVPIALTSAVVTNFSRNRASSWISVWGQHTLRSLLVGAPALLFMQRATGASRPGETEHGSRWKPFEDSNGVSGHAFIGAVPILTLAHMSENPFTRHLFYAASALTAWSRINDGAHFASQAFLGWYMAWEAADTVSGGDGKKDTLEIMPLISDGAYGLQLRLSW